MPKNRSDITASKLSDDVFEGPLAAYWVDVIGAYGDPIRRTIANPIIAYILDHFSKAPLAANSIAPDNLIQKASKKVRPILEQSCRKPTSPSDWMVEWHSSTDKLTTMFPDIGRSTLWDLGCGEGYLGRWLGGLGVRYFGVEPSRYLFEVCKRRATQNETYFNDSIAQFVREHASTAERPSLISLIGVLDGLSDPRRNLLQLSQLLQSRQLSTVPLLVATFDPDYFSSSLPRSREQYSKMRLGKHNHGIVTRDIGEWELIFSECDYFVIDQRPIHLNALPDCLPSYILDLWKEEVVGPKDLAHQVLPRYAPFYFWILVPRQERALHAGTTGRKQRGGDAKSLGEFVAFKAGDVMEVTGNLGSRVHWLKEGGARLEYAHTLKMLFGVDELFGQMEMRRNYFSSRILGPVVAEGDVVVQRFRFSDLTELMERERFVAGLFMSMVAHLDTVSYTRLITSRRVTKTEPKSKALTSEALTPVRNCAAVLLNACARRLAEKDWPANGYSGRILIRLTQEDVQRSIFHDALERRKSGRITETIEQFVQCNLIDCFSASLLTKFKAVDVPRDNAEEAVEADAENGLVASLKEADGVQENIAFVDDDLLESTHFLHLGTIAARHIKRALNASNDDFDIKFVAYAVSACLGSKTDNSHLANHVRGQRAGRRTKGNQTRIRTVAEIKSFLMDYLKAGSETLPEATFRMVENFIDRLVDEFNFYKKDGYEKEFSTFVLVKDVWGLLACVMNDRRIWQSSDVRKNNMSEYVRGSAQRHRLLAFFQECIYRLAEECGLLTYSDAAI
ncbi:MULTISPECIES: class I SAM-dependent methyltransferase [unclassified Bradyrhizobium]|uniref:class I SAM-dependent methyltransferase n=1 Tax=unclassified Bradyrhizobium TaxID=2631580 RepID=UPI0029160FDE|nr:MULTISPECIES: class I SAM-dependent methyltransferase [unclassified Bradyrhizobium]